VLRYNEDMVKKMRIPGQGEMLKALAEFRHQLRLFLHFSETAAQDCGLQPQQHQLLLQIAGAPDGVAATIGYAAERLGLRHNTVVELSDRCEKAGLLVRELAGSDRRCVLLKLTPKGWEKLEALSIDHARELNEFAPKLIRMLSKLRAVDRKPETIGSEGL
jgi:DNA-binding MarR family transcriptional regulator